MLKIPATLLVIAAIVSYPIAQPLFAQTRVVAEQTGAATLPLPAPSPDLKKIIAQNERQYRESSASVDVKALEKIDRDKTKRTGLTSRQKTYIVLGIIGIAALVFVLIKYGKECKTTSPPNCAQATDENCTCTEYKQNL